MDIISIGLFVWKILSFFLGFLGAVGEKMIDYVERPILKLIPFTDVREWVYDGVTSDEQEVYYGGTVAPGVLLKRAKSHAPRYFVHLRIRNETKHRGKNSTAKRVFAKLTFYNFDFSEELMPQDIYGRWAESIEPPMVLDKDSLKYIDILPSDEKTLDVATRYYIHNDWYAVSTESYTADQFENSMNLIKGISQDFNTPTNIFNVKVELNGENIGETHYFTVYNQGKGGIPEIVNLHGADDAEQSVHLTSGIRRHFQALSTPKKNPAPKRTQRPPTRK